MSSAEWILRACALTAFGCTSLAAADDSWHYTIDETRQEQQANFCASQRDVEEIAGVFDRFGSRAGYAALSGSPDCAVAVHTFTPRKILKTLTISEGKESEYQVYFVAVEDPRGDTLYLVTTRDVVTQ